MESLTQLYERRDRLTAWRDRKLKYANDAPEYDARKDDAYADVVDLNARLDVVEAEIDHAWKEVVVD